MSTLTVYRSYKLAVERFMERQLEWIMLWPLLVYALIFYIEPGLFERGIYYEYMGRIASQPAWELAFLLVATVRTLSLVTKMLWAWPYYSPFALAASVAAGTMWAQMSLSFLLVWYNGGDILSSFGAVSTLVLIELLNVGHSSRGVSALLKRSV